MPGPELRASATMNLCIFACEASTLRGLPEVSYMSIIALNTNLKVDSIPFQLWMSREAAVVVPLCSETLSELECL